MPSYMMAEKRSTYGGNMQISEEGKSLIKKFEGCVLDSYQDAVGVWTIGFGHTKNVKKGDTWSQSHAEEMLDAELIEYEDYIHEYVKVDLTQNQFDALVSWCYNLGPNSLKKSTMLKVLNKGNHQEVPHQIKRWNKAGGKVLEGLVRRREAEAVMFEGGEWKE
mgnify:CR=1 FL=1